jgi:hypothetical protein
MGGDNFSPKQGIKEKTAMCGRTERRCMGMYEISDCLRALIENEGGAKDFAEKYKLKQQAIERCLGDEKIQKKTATDIVTSVLTNATLADLAMCILFKKV